MKNLDNIKSTLNKIGLEEGAKKRLTQIALICQTIPVYEALKSVADATGKKEFGEFELEVGDNPLTACKLLLEASNNGEELDLIDIKLNDQSRVSLQEYKESNLTITGISKQNIAVFFTNRTSAYKNQQHKLFTYDATFDFDKKDNLVALEVEHKFSARGAKDWGQTISYDKKDVKNLLNQALTNQQEEDYIL